MDLTKYSTGLQHLGIPTNDMEATIAFYKQLGFEISYEVMNGEERVVFFKLGDFIVEAYQNMQAKMHGGAIDHIALNVLDIDETFAYINEIGLNNMNDEIHFLPFYTNGIKYFNIQGPNNETVEFSQYL